MTALKNKLGSIKKDHIIFAKVIIIKLVPVRKCPPIFLNWIFFIFAFASVMQSQSGFYSSNLPIIIIDTHGQEIKDEPKITASMGIIYNGDGNRNNVNTSFNHFDGQIGIEQRGNSTQYFPKKPYLIELRDSAGNNLNVPLLGMPSDNDWILLASYLDRTLIRDPLAHHLKSLTGEWSSRSRFCELVINGEYKGVFSLIENVKRGKNRVDVNKLTPEQTGGDTISGGFIYEVTGFGGDFGENRKLHYPEIAVINNRQLEFIRNYDDEFRNVMKSSQFNDSINGYGKWIDTKSFIDEILVQELMRNSDAYGWSAYFHKDRNKKLEAGPVWDFDQSTGNSTYMEGGKTTGWVIDYGTDQPFFWKKLFYETEFSRKLKLRWNELRKDKFRTEEIISFIDSCAGYLDEAQKRNFKQWPILGTFIWRETAGYEERNSYQEEIDYLKVYINERLKWMDTQLKIESPTVILNEDVLPEKFILEQNYPNPFNPSTTISYKIPFEAHVSLKVFDIIGREVDILVNETQCAGSYRITFEAGNLSDGVYFYTLSASDFKATKKIILIK